MSKDNATEKDKKASTVELIFFAISVSLGLLTSAIFYVFRSETDIPLSIIFGLILSITLFIAGVLWGIRDRLIDINQQIVDTSEQIASLRRVSSNSIRDAQSTFEIANLIFRIGEKDALVQSIGRNAIQNFIHNFAVDDNDDGTIEFYCEEAFTLECYNKFFEQSYCYTTKYVKCSAASDGAS